MIPLPEQWQLYAMMTAFAIFMCAAFTVSETIRIRAELGRGA